MKKGLIAVIALLIVCMFSIPAFADGREGRRPPGHRPMHHFPFGRPICWEWIDIFENTGTMRLYFVNIRPGHYLFSGVSVIEAGLGPNLPRHIPIHGNAQIIGDRIRMAGIQVDRATEDFGCQSIIDIDLDPVTLEATYIGTAFCSGEQADPGVFFYSASLTHIPCQ